MNQEHDDIPASLRRRKKEPEKAMQVRIPISHWKELAALGRDYDQNVSTFIREAIEDWLRRARKARNADTEGVKPRRLPE
jgi:post-segregation antitoxin (ccd killing protein)